MVNCFRSESEISSRRTQQLQTSPVINPVKQSQNKTTKSLTGSRYDHPSPTAETVSRPNIDNQSQTRQSNTSDLTGSMSNFNNQSQITQTVTSYQTDSIAFKNEKLIQKGTSPGRLQKLVSSLSPAENKSKSTSDGLSNHLSSKESKPVIPDTNMVTKR